MLSARRTKAVERVGSTPVKPVILIAAVAIVLAACAAPTVTAPAGSAGLLERGASV